jgi:hypothetical protein
MKDSPIQESPQAFTSIDSENLAAHLNEINVQAMTDFPLSAFPARIHDYITEINKAFNFPIEYIASTILFVLSLINAKSTKIIPKEGWEESSVLWLALIGKAGAAKSPVIKMITKPIMALEKKANLNYDQQLADYNALSKEAKAVQSPPTRVNFFTQDASIESLMQLHSENPRGIGICNDELSSWWGNLDRYQSNSEGVYLSAWDGSGNKINRLSRDSIYIDEMYVPVLGGTQPSKLQSLASDGRDSSGLMARILFCFPDNIRKGRWNKSNLNPSYAVYWENILLMIYERQADSNQRIPISKEAYEILEVWQHANAEQVDELGEGLQAEMFNKAERQCLRIALLLQVLYWACGEEDILNIGSRAIKHAIEITEYFKVQAKKVCDYLYESDPADKLPKRKREFYNALPDVFQAKEAIEIASKFNISRATFYRMTKIEGLLQKIGACEYTKTA